MPSVKLSHELVLEARMTGGQAERSLAGQIEYWAGLGRAVERVLRVPEVLLLKSRGSAMSLTQSIKSAHSKEGRARLANVLDAKPFPHFETAEKTGYLVRIDEDGTRTVGRFVNRVFVAENETGKCFEAR